MRFTRWVQELHTFVIHAFCTRTVDHCASNALPYTLIPFVFVFQLNHILCIVQNLILQIYTVSELYCMHDIACMYACVVQRIGGSFRISKHVSLHLPRARVMIATEDLKATVSDSRKLICDTLFIIHSIPIHNNNVNKTKQTEKYTIIHHSSWKVVWTMLSLPEVPVHLHTPSKHAGGAGEVSVGHPAGWAY